MNDELEFVITLFSLAAVKFGIIALAIWAVYKFYKAIAGIREGLSQLVELQRDKKREDS